MDIVVKILCAVPALALVFGLWPVLLGCTLGFKKWIDRYIVGFCAVQALFFIVYIPAILFGWPSRTLTGVAAGVISLVGLLGSWLRYYAAADKRSLLGVCRPSFAYFKNPLFDAAIVIVLYQVARYVIKQPYIYGDDVTYITMITDYVDTNAIYVKTWTGQVEPLPLSAVSFKYVFTSYYPFLGSISILSGLHPLILCKTVLPVIYVPVHYLIVFRIGQYLFGDENDVRVGVEKQSVFMFFYVLLIEFGQISYYTISRRLMIWVWNSKSDCFCLLLVPLFFYTFMLLTDRVETERVLGDTSLFYRQFLIAVIALACNSATLMGLIMSAIVMGVWFVIAAFRLKKPSVLFTSLWTLVPHVVTAVILFSYWQVAY